MTGSIYLDVCSLCRPFDDQKYSRVKIETEAINLIFEEIQKGIYSLLVSPVLYSEIDGINDIFIRTKIEKILDVFGKSIKVDFIEARKITEELISKGFGIADAAHISFAGLYNADFITCDDKLIKKCKKHSLSLWCDNPIKFCLKEGLI